MLFREIEARDINARSCLRESLELESISNRVSEDSELEYFEMFSKIPFEWFLILFFYPFILESV